MMQLHPVLNDSKFFKKILIFLILVVFAQSGFWIAVPVTESRIVYERKTDSQVFYVLPVESILGKLPVVPVGDTRTIPS